MREKKPLNVEVGARIKQARLDAGMTQEQLAEAIQIGVKHVSMIECGTTGISLSGMLKICAALNVTSDELLYGRSVQSRTAALARRMETLRPEHFAVVEDIVNRLLIAFSEG